MVRRSSTSSVGSGSWHLLCFSQPKLRHFHSGSGSPLGGRSFEVETTAFGVGGRVAVGESGSAGAGESEGPDLETAIAYLEKTCTAHTAVPAPCRSVGAYEWMGFSGPFHRGPRVRDWGLHDKGVYTFTSHENPLLCPQFTGESECSGVEVLLCGSAQHVIGEEDQPRTRRSAGNATSGPSDQHAAVRLSAYTRASVRVMMSENVVPGAVSTRARPRSVTSRTPRSVMMRCTHC